jgi:hypothetical protein
MARLIFGFRCLYCFMVACVSHAEIAGGWDRQLAGAAATSKKQTVPPPVGVMKGRRNYEQCRLGSFIRTNLCTAIGRTFYLSQGINSPAAIARALR